MSWQHILLLAWLTLEMVGSAFFLDTEPPPRDIKWLAKQQITFLLFGVLLVAGS